MSNSRISWQKIVITTLSISALIFSYLSWDVSIQSFNYVAKRDSIINPPEIREYIDSTKISFSLNNYSAEIQNLTIVFPKIITDKVTRIISKPIELQKITLEKLVKNYLRKKLKNPDATEIEGTFSIPVMMNYSAIVYGQHYSLRENRLLMFHYHYKNSVTNISYSNTIIGNRCGYPLRLHYFFVVPFGESLEKKVEKQDSIDVQEHLEKQLKNITH